MAVATTLAVAGLALAVVGTGVQFIAGQKQAKIAKKSAKVQERAANLARRRRQRETIRQARILRGQAENTAAAVGAAGSSGIKGGVSSLGSQRDSNLGFSSQEGGIQGELTGLSIKSASAARLGSIGSGVANLGSGLFGLSGSSLFNKAPAPRTAPSFSPSPFAGTRPGR